MIAAHLIVGPREEPFLPALLASIETAAQALIVNDNGPDPSPHAGILASSAFGRAGRLLVDRTPFVDFASARNVCLRLHREHAAGAWVMFVDADEVHAAEISRIASRLDRVPAAYDFIDGYTWHFFQSFDWYTSIERRMMFFRFRPEVRWEGAVHERVAGLWGKRLALPYVYGHYGHVLPPRRHAEKEKLYSSLGGPGVITPDDQLDSIDVTTYFARFYPRLLAFGGAHPHAVRPFIEPMRAQFERYHVQTERLTRGAGLRARLRNAAWRLNYEQRWRSRALNPLARSLVAPP